jgi:adenylosuccinate synthase
MGNKGNTVVIGTAWGDEGKAKTINRLLPHYDIDGRFNGGANRGGTLKVNGKEFVVHTLMSGIFNPNILLYGGSGLLINPNKFSKEIVDAHEAGANLEGRLHLSPYSALVQPSHTLFDSVTGKGIGTTNNGIGPVCSDRALRMLNDVVKHIRLCDYLANPQLKKHVEDNLNEVIESKRITGIDVRREVDKFDAGTHFLGRYMVERDWLAEKLDSGMNVFFEGANSIMLDLVKGYVPFNSATHTIPGAVYVGGDMPHTHPIDAEGVVKAITSRVGNGKLHGEFGGSRSDEHCRKIYFEDGVEKSYYSREREKAFFNPHELLKSSDPLDIGIALRILLGEYGASTGRPRRLAPFDAAMQKQICSEYYLSKLHINVVDGLKWFSETNLPGIPIIVGHKDQNNVTLKRMPLTVYENENITPIIEYLPMIRDDISGMRTYTELPKSIKHFIGFIQEYIGRRTKIESIGVGPSDEQLILIP